MSNIHIKSLIFLLIFCSIISCKSQNSENMIDRKPAVSGQFYKSDKDSLKKELDFLFTKATAKQIENLRAIISPHAGYIFSGQVAASSFNQIDTSREYKNIFIIGTSHHTYLKGASIYNKGNYITPFGEVKVNIELANQLINNYSVFEYNQIAHKNEHSNEVQLPFLQYKLNYDFMIVPIIIGTNSTDTIKKISEALKPYFVEENLFVISTDFSHYPDYDDACKIDSITANSITANSSTQFINTIEKNKKKKIRNLSTSICGWSATLSLIYLTEKEQNIKYKIIEYQNSGDALLGDKDRVVGYYSIAAYANKEENFALSDEEKKFLLRIARLSIEKYLENGEEIEIDTNQLTQNLKTKCGAFVSLHKSKSLRGCIGRFGEGSELYKIVQQMAIASATEDTRFSIVKLSEMEDIEIEISVLTPLKKIENLDEFEMGKHGIYIRKGFNTGTYLPQVAEQVNWSKEEFVSHCSENKAGIGAEGWKTAELFTYEAIVFSEEDFK